VITKHYKCSKKGHIPLTKEEYNNLFCSDEKIMREAYDKAWTTRNFEIDKFWLRTAFFWGFIAMIFGGYIKVMTSEDNEKLLSMNFDIYLIMLGITFSVAWFLVILGSKSWQENWEAHIDMLEDKITGPLYKTINCNRFPFYSVSKINIYLSVVIIFVWIAILVLSIVQTKAYEDICTIAIAIVLTILAIILLLVLCRSGCGRWRLKRSIRKYLKGHKGGGSLTRFINR
jgi:membrane protease YdiL (CAAX protease family)